MGRSTNTLLDAALHGQLPDDHEALTLARETDTRALAAIAAQLRDRGVGDLVTYSRKVFIPLTHLCRDVCHYCTFAQSPRRIDAPYMSIERVLEVARQGKALGCKEALFTLGEKPELRYKAAREGLEQMGYATTIEYLHAAAKAVLDETGLLPHANPGTMTDAEIELLRQVSPSMGIMLETASSRLSDKGMPHYGSPDKDPEVRLDTLRRAGAARVPFTSGILIGIGETPPQSLMPAAMICGSTPGLRFGGACMLMPRPKTMRATAMVHNSSSRSGSGARAIAVPAFARKFCTMIS